MIITMLDQLFKVNPMVVVLAIVVILLLLVAFSLFHAAYRVLTDDDITTEKEGL